MWRKIVYFNSELEQRYGSKSSFRWATFKAAINMFIQRGGIYICETGCVRQKDDYGAGYSTVIFGDTLKTLGHGRLDSVDNNEAHLNICKELTKEYADYLVYHLDDSVSFLEKHDHRIDLLYLDSYDYPVDDNAEEIQKSQTHCLNEIKAAYDKLDEKSIILIDDNSLPGGGKPGLAKEFLIDRDWMCVLDYQQTLWIRK